MVGDLPYHPLTTEFPPLPRHSKVQNWHLGAHPFLHPSQHPTTSPGSAETKPALLRMIRWWAASLNANRPRDDRPTSASQKQDLAPGSAPIFASIPAPHHVPVLCKEQTSCVGSSELLDNPLSASSGGNPTHCPTGFGSAAGLNTNSCLGKRRGGGKQRAEGMEAHLGASLTAHVQEMLKDPPPPHCTISPPPPPPPLVQRQGTPPNPRSPKNPPHPASPCKEKKETHPTQKHKPRTLTDSTTT